MYGNIGYAGFFPSHPVRTLPPVQGVNNRQSFKIIDLTVPGRQGQTPPPTQGIQETLIIDLSIEGRKPAMQAAVQEVRDKIASGQTLSKADTLIVDLIIEG